MNTRLIVKNLPKHLTEKRLQEHFAQKGTVTDARIIKTKDGKSRQFGFVGYRSEEEAKAARYYFDKTYIDTSKIEVEFAKRVGDDTIGRSWSKYTPGSSAHEKSQPEKSPKKSGSEPKDQKSSNASNLFAQMFGNAFDDEEEQSNEFQEFRAVERGREKGKKWADDSIALRADEIEKSRERKKAAKEKLINKSKTVIAEGIKAKVVKKEVDSLKTGGENTKYEKKHYQFLSDDDESDEDLYQDFPNANNNSKFAPKEDESAENEENDEEANGSHDTEESDEEQEKEKNHSKKRKRSEEVKGIDDDDEENAGDSEAETGNPKEDGDKIPEHEMVDVEDTGRLFVRNLLYTVTEEDLSKAFGKFGELSEIHIPIDPQLKRGKGFAFILYMVPIDAIKAMKKLDGSIFQGRIIHVLPAASQKQYERIATPHVPGSSEFKKKKEQEEKEDMSNDQRWNALFVRGDTAATSMAKKLGISKGEFLSGEADNLAVRMALAETHAITETKQMLENEGIDLDVLKMHTIGGKSTKSIRSNTIILAKNLPSDCTENEVKSLFGRFGNLGRVALPESRVLAMIEYLEPNDAKKAFKELAYSKFHHIPLYLEWAPQKIFKTELTKEQLAEMAEERKRKEAAAAAVAENKAVPAVNVQEIAGIDVLEKDDAHTPTLFVKNLSFNTTDESLLQFMMAAGNVRTAMVARRMNPKKKGETLSMGYGFVEFYSHEEAVKAMKKLQGALLDGHTVQLSFSVGKSKPKEVKSTRKGAQNVEEKFASHKLLVKNLAFQAKKKDLRDLFGSFGDVKKVRIPKKFDGTSRGYGFVEFATKQLAKTAMEALSHTHFYGRKLVIEYAKEDETVEQVREKTAQQLKKQKKN